MELDIVKALLGKKDPLDFLRSEALSVSNGPHHLP